MKSGNIISVFLNGKLKDVCNKWPLIYAIDDKYNQQQINNKQWKFWKMRKDRNNIFNIYLIGP